MDTFLFKNKSEMEIKLHTQNTIVAYATVRTILSQPFHSIIMVEMMLFMNQIIGETRQRTKGRKIIQ